MDNKELDEVSILVAEDDTGIVTLLRSFFEQNGATVWIEDSGKHVLERVKTFQPDIVILDVVMPYVDGLTALSLTRPRHELKGQISGKSMRSDTVLEKYYKDFCDILKQNNKNVYMLKGDYPSLGAIPMAEDQFLGLSEENDKDIIGQTGELKTDKIRTFIFEETVRLTDIIESWHRYIEGGTSEDLESKISECDYLTLPLDESNRNVVFYSEAVKKARRYRNILNGEDSYGKN